MKNFRTPTLANIVTVVALSWASTYSLSRLKMHACLTDGNSTINVVYRGDPVPSLAEEQQSVAVGKLVSPQTFQASQLLVKCHSKYESQEQTSLFSTPLFPIALLVGSVAIGFSAVSITLSKRKK